MKPKEKAKELYEKYNRKFNTLKGTSWVLFHREAKESALICVAEIMNTGMLIDEEIYVETPSYLAYWIDVRDELLAL